MPNSGVHIIQFTDAFNLKDTIKDKYFYSALYYFKHKRKQIFCNTAQTADPGPPGTKKAAWILLVIHRNACACRTVLLTGGHDSVTRNRHRRVETYCTLSLSQDRAGQRSPRQHWERRPSTWSRCCRTQCTRSGNRSASNHRDELC